MNYINTLLDQASQQYEHYGLVHNSIGHFYYINHPATGKHITLTMPTRLKKEGITVHTGDIIHYNPYSKTVTGHIPRINLLQKPKVANIDQAIILIACTSPEPDYIHLDKLIVNIQMVFKNKPILALSKHDLIDKNNTAQTINAIYKPLGYKIINVYADQENQELIDILENKTSVITGKSGVGKSTLINKLCPELNLKTKPISAISQTGVHTTRIIKIYELDNIKNGRLLDTPGFSQLAMNFTPLDLLTQNIFPEFINHECEYKDCLHLPEQSQGCKVKLHPSRQYSYELIMNSAFEFEYEQLVNNKLKQNLNPQENIKINQGKTIPKLDMKYRNFDRKSI